MGIVAGSMLFIFMQVGSLQKDDDFVEGHLEPHQVRRKLPVTLIKDKNNTAQERALNQVDGHHHRRMAMKESMTCWKVLDKISRVVSFELLVIC